MAPSRLVALLLPVLALLACGRSPEDAQKKLAEQKVPASSEALLAKTKEGQAGQATATLLAEAGVDPNSRQANGMTVLMSAAFNGQHDTAQALIARGADVNATAKDFTALRLAVEKGDIKMAKLLLDKGANPALRADGGPSPLDKADESGNREMLDLLKSRAK